MADENLEVTPPADENKPATPPAANPADLEVNKPAPVAPPAEQPAPFAPTGDAAMDVALDFFSKAGLKPDSVALTLAQKGDFSVLKAELAAKGKQGWEAFVNIAEQSFGRAKSAAEAKAASTKAAVLAVAGDEETWNAIKTFVAEKADAAELAEINAALKSGGLLAKATAKYMKDAYVAGGGKLPGAAEEEVLSPNRARPESNANGPLTAAEYSAAVQALAAKVGAHRVDGTAEYKALQARRRAAMR